MSFGNKQFHRVEINDHYHKCLLCVVLSQSLCHVLLMWINMINKKNTLILILVSPFATFFLRYNITDSVIIKC